MRGRRYGRLRPARSGHPELVSRVSVQGRLGRPVSSSGSSFNASLQDGWPPEPLIVHCANLVAAISGARSVINCRCGLPPANAAGAGSSTQTDRVAYCFLRGRARREKRLRLPCLRAVCGPRSRHGTSAVSRRGCGPGCSSAPCPLTARRAQQHTQLSGGTSRSARAPPKRRRWRRVIGPLVPTAPVRLGGGLPPDRAGRTRRPVVRGRHGPVKVPERGECRPRRAERHRGAGPSPGRVAPARGRQRLPVTAP